MQLLLRDILRCIAGKYHFQMSVDRPKPPCGRARHLACQASDFRREFHNMVLKLRWERFRLTGRWSIV